MPLITRPILVRLCGPSCLDALGGMAWLEARATTFLAGRRTLRVGADTKMFVCQLQHEVMLGIQLMATDCH